MWREASVTAFCTAVSVPRLSGRPRASGAHLLPHHPLLFFIKRLWSSVFLHCFLFTPSLTDALLLRISSRSYWRSAATFAAFLSFSLPALATLCLPDLQSVHCRLTPSDCKGIALFDCAACAVKEQPLRVIKRLPLGVLMKLIEFSELLHSESLEIS